MFKAPFVAIVCPCSLSLHGILLFLFFFMSILSLATKILFENFDQNISLLISNAHTMKENTRCTICKVLISGPLFFFIYIHSHWLFAFTHYTNCGSTSKPSTCPFLYLDHSFTDIPVCSIHIHFCIPFKRPQKA